MGVRNEALVNTKVFLPLPHVDLFHTYNGVVANPRPWVIEVESYVPRYQSLGEGHAVHKWALRRLTGHHCKALIFTSGSALKLNREQLVKAGVDPAKMHVVYRAVEQFEPQGRDERFFTILFAGLGFYRKGGLELLRAFLQLNRPEARLEIISTLETDWGLCPMPAEKAWAERTIADDPRITLLRQLSHEQVIARMRAADLFVSTTFLDPFNNTVLEAMGTGLPVLCSATGALPEMVEDGRNGWMLPLDGKDSGDIAAWTAERILKLMDDKALRLRMGQEGRAIVAERFSLDVRNAALTRIYDAAVGRS
jgi:glycosyltransferase involved in cell wall biosynthesis